MRIAPSLVFALSTLTACASSRVAPSPSASSSLTEPVSSRAGAGAGVGDAREASDAGPALCGCSLCAPVVSDDACAKDDDCAPATPCHATRCVGRANAAPRPADLTCTMMMACQSVDANKCGCMSGRCALMPRSGPH